MIRRACVDDIDVVADLEVEALPDDAWSEDYLARAIKGELPTIEVWVDEHVYAVVSVTFEVAEVQRIGVAAEARRGGRASAFLRELALDLARRDVERIVLEVRESNEAARELYRGLGFRDLDRRPRYYADGADAYVLEWRIA